MLNHSRTATALWEALPLTGRGNLWGDEFYFSVALSFPPEEPVDRVEAGTIAYWPDGPAVCVFWGPTPISRGPEIQPASPVTIVGRVLDDLALLRRVRGGTATLVREEPA